MIVVVVVVGVGGVGRRGLWGVHLNRGVVSCDRVICFFCVLVVRVAVYFVGGGGSMGSNRVILVENMFVSRCRSRTVGSNGSTLGCVM